MPATAEAEDWREYIRAAERKIGIAGYHLEQLRQEPAEGSQPSMPQQASFEGVITTFVAATEQVAGAIHVATGGSGSSHELTRMLERMQASPIRDELKQWNRHPIVRDVREIRNRSAHRYYSKAGTEVQKPPRGTAYTGSRGLVPYCSVAVSHLECLTPLLGQLQAELGGLHLRDI